MLAPRGLHQTQHRIELIAAAVQHQCLVLRRCQLQPHAQAGLPLHQCIDEDGTAFGALRGLLGAVITDKMFKKKPR